MTAPTLYGVLCPAGGLLQRALGGPLVSHDPDELLAAIEEFPEAERDWYAVVPVTARDVEKAGRE